MSNNSEFTNGYALLIGVGRYKDELLSVPATAQDAVDVGRILTNPNLCAYPESQVHILTNKKATKTEILDKLETLKDQVREEDNSTVIIFFSGHGWLEGEYYFLPHETVTTRSNGKLQVELDTALANKDFLGMIRQIQARRLVILLSTCFAGGAGTALSPEIEHSSQLAPVPLGVLDELSQGSGRVIISSSSPKQRSWIKSGATNSIFGTHLLAGLNGHGIKAIGNTIGILDLFTHLSETVPLDAQTIGVSQDPEIKAYSLNRNFPIAMFLGGKSLSLSLDAAPGAIMPSKVTYYTAEIRKLLRGGLSDQDLNDLCMDHFRTVYDQFSLGMDKSQKISSLIEYCSRHNKFPQLLVLVKGLNPEKYAEYERTLTSAGQ